MKLDSLFYKTHEIYAVYYKTQLVKLARVFLMLNKDTLLPFKENISAVDDDTVSTNNNSSLILTDFTIAYDRDVNPYDAVLNTLMVNPEFTVNLRDVNSANVLDHFNINSFVDASDYESRSAKTNTNENILNESAANSANISFNSVDEDDLIVNINYPTIQDTIKSEINQEVSILNNNLESDIFISDNLNQNSNEDNMLFSNNISFKITASKLESNSDNIFIGETNLARTVKEDSLELTNVLLIHESAIPYLKEFTEITNNNKTSINQQIKTLSIYPKQFDNREAISIGFKLNSTFTKTTKDFSKVKQHINTNIESNTLYSTKEKSIQNNSIESNIDGTIKPIWVKVVSSDSIFIRQASELISSGMYLQII